MIMLQDNRAGRHGAPRRHNRRRSPRTLIAAVSGALVIALAVGIGVLTTRPASHSTPPETANHPKVTAKIAPPASWNLAFDASFPGSQLDTKTWATCFPWATGGCTNYGNNGEDKEWYQASQVQVSGGALHLVAQREPTAGLTQKGAAKEYACRSGMVTTFPSFRFEYGYVQVVAKVPFSNGLWPGLWLAAANKQWPPEVDLLEHWGTQADGKVYLHPTTGARQGGVVSTPGLASGWHTFTLYWTKSRLSWYYDGVQVFSTTTGVPQQSMYLIANLADYDTSAGTCSGQFSIKSVQVWQP
jgi:beta-glucanase (GH16 family)